MSIFDALKQKIQAASSPGVTSSPSIDPALVSQLKQKGAAVYDIKGNIDLDASTKKLKAMNAIKATSIIPTKTSTFQERTAALPVSASGLPKATTEAPHVVLPSPFKESKISEVPKGEPYTTSVKMPQYIAPATQAQQTVKKQASYGPAPEISPIKEIGKTALSNLGKTYESGLQATRATAIAAAAPYAAMLTYGLSQALPENITYEQIYSSILDNARAQLPKEQWGQEAENIFEKGAQEYLRSQLQANKKLTGADVAVTTLFGAADFITDPFIVGPALTKGMQSLKNMLMYEKVGETLAGAPSKFVKAGDIYKLKITPIRNASVEIVIDPLKKVKLTPTREGNIIIEGFQKRFGGSYAPLKQNVASLDYLTQGIRDAAEIPAFKVAKTPAKSAIIPTKATTIKPPVTPAVKSLEGIVPKPAVIEPTPSTVIPETITPTQVIPEIPAKIEQPPELDTKAIAFSEDVLQKRVDGLKQKGFEVVDVPVSTQLGKGIQQTEITMKHPAGNEIKVISRSDGNKTITRLTTEALDEDPFIGTVFEEPAFKVMTLQNKINQLEGLIRKLDNEVRFKYDGDGYGYIREQIYQQKAEIQNTIKELKSNIEPGFKSLTQDELGNKFVEYLGTKLDDWKRQPTPIKDRIIREEASNFIEDFKKRHKVDFDNHVVDVIFTGEKDGNLLQTAYGVTYGNEIALTKMITTFAKQHEVGHLVYRNLEKIPSFKRFTKEILNAEIAKLHTAEEIKTKGYEELIQEDFEKFLEQVQNNKPITFTGKLLEFFQKIYEKMKDFFGLKKGTKLEDFYKELATGRAPIMAKKVTIVPKKILPKVETKAKTVIRFKKPTKAVVKKEIPVFKRKPTIKQQIAKATEGKIPETKITTTEKSLLLKKLTDIKAGAQTAKKVEQEVAKRQSDAYKRQIVRVEKATRREEKSRIIELVKQKTSEVQDIKNKIVNYTKENISTDNRGKLLEAVKNAKTKGDLANAMLKVDNINRAEKAKEIITSIKEATTDVANLPIETKKQIDEFLKDFKFSTSREDTIQKLLKSKEWMDAGNDLPNRIKMQIEMLEKTNLKELPINKLEDIKAKLDVLVNEGKTKMRIRKEIEDLRHDAMMEKVKVGSKNLDIEVKKRTPGRPSTEETWTERWTKMKDFTQSADWQLTGIERFFNKLDGYKNYEGVNYKTFYEPVKHANDKVLKEYIEITIKAAKLEKQLSLSTYDYEKIGMYAVLQQPGGYEKLIANGYSPKMISGIHLNDRQMKMYNFMRKTLDEYYPRLNEVMQKQYNKSLGFTKNYFPFQTDFEQTKSIADQIESLYRRTSVDRSFSKQRTQFAAPVKINAGKIFDGYIKNAVHFIHMNNVVKNIAKIAKDPRYAEAVGEKARQYVLDWIDLEARAGKATPRYRFLNKLRANLGVAVLGFKLSSALIQPMAKIEGAMELGAKWAFRYDKDFITKPEIRKFIVDSSPELRSRIGDDPGYSELSENPTWKKTQQVAMWTLQRLDSLTAGSVWYNAYRKKLAELGIEFDINKVNQQALDYADRVVRITQASPMYKDMPPALTGKHRDLAKTLFTFQSFMLNKWNYIKEDLITQGIVSIQDAKLIDDPKASKQARDKAISKVAQQLFFLVMGVFAEEALRNTMSQLYYGKKYEEKLPKKIFNAFVENIPVLSQIASTFEYNQVPFPLGSTAQALVTGSKAMVKGKTMKSKITGTVKLLTAIGQLGGVPGTSEASKLIRGPIIRIFESLGKKKTNPYGIKKDTIVPVKTNTNPYGIKKK